MPETKLEELIKRALALSKEDRKWLLGELLKSLEPQVK